MRDPDLGKERTRDPHKKDMAIKENSNNGLYPFTFLYRSNEKFQEIASLFTLFVSFIALLLSFY